MVSSDEMTKNSSWHFIESAMVGVDDPNWLSVLAIVAVVVTGRSTQPYWKLMKKERNQGGNGIGSNEDIYNNAGNKYKREIRSDQYYNIVLFK